MDRSGHQRDGTKAAREPDEDDTPTSDPKEMLDLLETQRSDARHQLSIDGRLLYLAWGIAWVVGYLAMFLSTPHGHEPVLPQAVGGGVFAAVAIGAGAVTAVHTHRRVSGIRGPSSAQGTMWGFTWLLGFAAMFAIGSGLVRAGLDDRLIALYYTGVSGLVVALLYLAAGALWHDRTMYTLGICLLVVFSAAVLVGLPWGYLILCILGGGAFLTASVWDAHRMRAHCAPA